MRRWPTPADAVRGFRECRASSTRRGTTPRAFSSRRWNSANKTSLATTQPTGSSSRVVGALPPHIHMRTRGAQHADPCAHSLTHAQTHANDATVSGTKADRHCLDGPTSVVRLTGKVEEPRSRLLSHTQLVALPLRFGAATEPETVTACVRCAGQSVPIGRTRLRQGALRVARKLR